MAGANGASARRELLLPRGQRQGPAEPGENKLPSPDQKSFHISTTPTNRGRKRSSPWSIPLRTVWKRQPHWLVADWLGIMKPARGESFHWGKRRGPAAPGKDKFPSPDQKSFSTSTTPKSRGQKWRSPGSISPGTMWKPQPQWRVADWLVLMEPARGESSPSGQHRGSTAPGED